MLGCQPSIAPVVNGKGRIYVAMSSCACMQPCLLYRQTYLGVIPLECYGRNTAVFDINTWFHHQAARRIQSQTTTGIQQALASVQQAGAVVQQALAAPSEPSALSALAELSKAASDAKSATLAVHRLVVDEQQRTQGAVSEGLASGAWLPVQTTETLADQLEQTRPSLVADRTGQAMMAYLRRASDVTQALQSALAQATQVLNGTQAAGTAYDEQQNQSRALAQEQQNQSRALVRERQKYLAQFGGIDPQEVIDRVKSGQYPSVPTGIMLHKGEIALYAVPASLAEDKTTRKYVGGSTGYSIPLGHGFRFRVGSYQGHTISREQLTKVDQGTVIVTTKRIVYNGSRRSLTIPSNQVLNTVLYRDGVDVRTENRAKREVFQCKNPLLLNTYILVTCQLA
jgi:hypothetical protein